MIKVFGHKSPDTDATLSAIIFAWYIKNHTARDAEPFVLGSLNKETEFILKKWDMKAPQLLENLEKGDDVMIVDTNNPQELPENILDCNILQVVDHHKLWGGLETKSPLDMTIRTFASTGSVIYSLMSETAKKDLPENIAGLVLSCILSDTLEFRSPTTTPYDREVANHLASKLGIDIKQYADKMFDAKSDVSDFTDKGLVHLDSKKTALGDKNVRVSVVETTNPKSIIDRKEGIVEAIKEVIKEDGDIDDVLFFVVDILKEEAIVFTYNDFIKNIISVSFGTSKEGDLQVLPGIVSRKKQILPMLKLD
jgi:manganese-dependent inorganic pyrophosphatase